MLNPLDSDFPTLDGLIEVAGHGFEDSDDVAGSDMVREVLGYSREGREVVGYRIGQGDIRVSLLGGCHADEPVGPRLLRILVRALSSDVVSVSGLKGIEWWIIPHINPDGERANAEWQEPEPGLTEGYDLPDYLHSVRRELPGDDIEFGFPRNSDDLGARPEPTAARRWWGTAQGPFDLHISFHGMGFAAGPWFLIDEAWVGRTEALRDAISGHVAATGYTLHDIERYGEKGFTRISRGFCTRPNSNAMAEFFLQRNDPDTAALFRPSSMETHRSLAADLGGDCLTLVTEMPLFLLPGVGEMLGPPDPQAEHWKEMIALWRRQVAESITAELRHAIADSGVSAMPVGDQMRLQWALLLEAVGIVRAKG